MWSFAFFIWAGILFLVGFANFCRYGILDSKIIACFILASFLATGSRFLHLLETNRYLFRIDDRIEALTKSIAELVKNYQKAQFESPASVKNRNNASPLKSLKKIDNGK